MDVCLNLYILIFNFFNILRNFYFYFLGPFKSYIRDNHHLGKMMICYKMSAKPCIASYKYVPVCTLSMHITIKN